MPTFSNMKDLEKHLSKTVDGEVGFSEMFDLDFMNKHTEYSNIYEFLRDGGVSCEDDRQWSQVNIFELNQYVTKNTQFLTWDDMEKAAGTIYIAKKLGAK